MAETLFPRWERPTEVGPWLEMYAVPPQGGERPGDLIERPGGSGDQLVVLATTEHGLMATPLWCLRWLRTHNRVEADLSGDILAVVQRVLVVDESRS